MLLVTATDKGGVPVNIGVFAASAFRLNIGRMQAETAISRLASVEVQLENSCEFPVIGWVFRTVSGFIGAFEMLYMTFPGNIWRLG
ncbi:MAG: hypothetical protein ABI144_11960 [Gallionella sp.]